MADWDGPDLLARCKRVRRRPTTDEGTSDTQWYQMLTEAEAVWKPIIAAHAPETMYGAPLLMTTTDSKVYTMPGVTDPLSFIVLESLTGEPLKAGAFWDEGSDYVWEGGNTIRITGGRERSFASGPYLRYIAGPGTIDAATDSTILPARFRLLLVYQACAYDAERGGMDNPLPYEARLQQLAFGDPEKPGDVGMLGAYKAQHILGGMASVPGYGYRWWRPNG